MNRSGALAVLVSSLACLALACAPPHATLRRAFDMSAWTPISKQTIREAALARFPIGTTEDTVQAGLPESHKTNPTAAWLWGWHDDWAAGYCFDGALGAESTDYASLLGHWYYVIRFYFTDGLLKDVVVQKGDVHL